MEHAFGIGFKIMPWATRGKDAVLARKLLGEVELKDAKEMVTVFFDGWKAQRREGTPGFGLFWSMRESILARVTGHAKSYKDSLGDSEYDEKLAAEAPDVGWGF